MSKTFEVQRQESNSASYFVSCRTRDSLNFTSFEVCQAIYIYVQQLECYIKHPKESKLKEVYAERFQ